MIHIFDRKIPSLEDAIRDVTGIHILRLEPGRKFEISVGAGEYVVGEAGNERGLRSKYIKTKDFTVSLWEIRNVQPVQIFKYLLSRKIQKWNLKAVVVTMVRDLVVSSNFIIRLPTPEQLEECGPPGGNVSMLQDLGIRPCDLATRYNLERPGPSQGQAIRSDEVINMEASALPPRGPRRYQDRIYDSNDYLDFWGVGRSR